MATTFTDAYEKVFGKVESNLRAFTVSDRLAGREAHNALVRNGGGKQYQYTSYGEGTAQDITQYTDLDIDGYTAVATVMDLDKESSYAFNLDEWDKSKYAGADEFLTNRAIDAVKVLTREQDGEWLNRYQDANNNFGSTFVATASAVTPITLTTSNVLQTVMDSNAELERLTGMTGENFMVATPKQISIMGQQNVINGFKVADSVLQNGFVGTTFTGINVYRSSYLTHEIQLTNTGNVSADDTFTINGVTFTFKAAPAVANEVDLGVDAETSFANLAAAINQGAGAGTAYIAASSADARILRGFEASATATVLTLTHKWGQFTSSESLANVTVTKAQTAHVIVGEQGCIELASPMGIKNYVRQEPRQLTENYISATQFGVKTPKINKDKFLNVEIYV